ncbi:hypothetical protein CC1G_04245 [Coprinopsis cinerea okayama7|uniref:Uncharacterized protein n=1 Tax=Coprinopsis cinerea (strain Okayama-7 / 130 / ATCC MYA-4618 / FGSC 9003) TaxID=240176 RepID=A8NFE9_COPC7|nr:hypothetical protein CC1G_04245 [Coprinopsis cinerea okayama7\|eukprot:XP_001833266.2 hypothetical protein CC1G_04245 [Coprinopsis cinerea okayama7\
MAQDEMAAYGIVPQKIELRPRRYHGFAFLLFIMGTLLPPLAVAARFGIGKDFWINVVLTLMGYIPGHGHNFYIQNIRNNKNHARTPKWVQKYGLVDLSEIRRKERKSQWANRYKDRLPHSTLEGQPYEEGQEAGSSVNINDINGSAQRQANGELWRSEEEMYYNSNKSTSSSGRWHYPANFDDAVIDRALVKQKKKKKDKKNRWERTQDAYSLPPDEDGSSRKRRKKKRKGMSTVDSIDTQSTNSGSHEYPEDPEGGVYGNSSRLPHEEDDRRRDKNNRTTDEDLFGHEF